MPKLDLYLSETELKILQKKQRKNERLTETLKRIVIEEEMKK